MRKAAFICLEPIISMPQSLVVGCFFLAAACGQFTTDCKYPDASAVLSAAGPEQMNKRRRPPHQCSVDKIKLAMQGRIMT